MVADNENEVKRKRLSAMLFCCVFMFSFSISSAVYYTLQPRIIEYFGITLQTSSWISAVSSAGNMAINLMLVNMGDRFNKGRLLAVLTGVLGLTLFGIGFAPKMGIFLIFNAVSGIVSWWIDNLTTAYVSDMYGEERGRYIAVLYTLFAVGSAVAPMLTGFITTYLKLSWQTVYFILGGILACAWVLYTIFILASGTPELSQVYHCDEKKTERKLPVKSMLANRNMLALIISGITMAFYSYFSSTLPTYFSFTQREMFDAGIPNIIAAASAIGALVSRVVYVPLAPKINKIKYLRFQSLFCTVVDLVCLVINKPWLWIVLETVAGLAYGCSYTMTVVLTCDEYPEYSSSACAATSFASGTAYLIATPIINFIAERVSFFIAMLIPVGFGFLTYFVYKFVYKERTEYSSADTKFQLSEGGNA